MSILGARRQPPFDVATFSVGAIVAGLAFLLYFLTAARDIVVGDTPELITAAVTLGVPHPPGYPLFTMLGHLFSLLPVGPIPFRVNLLAATCDALTVGIVYLTALRVSRSRLPAAIAALMLAVSPLFWTWSLVSEVFPLNNLLASLMIYLLVRWHEQPERSGFLVATFLVGGLALTNHQTVVLLAPAFGFLLWRGRAIWRRRPQIFAICIGAFLIGLLPYVYVLWAAARHPVINWGSVSSLRDLFALITRKSYGTRHLVSSAEYVGGSPADRVLALCLSFGPLLGTLIVLGLIYAYQHRRWYFWFNVLAFASAGLFFTVIANLNLASNPFSLYVLERFFILPQVVLAPAMALGLLLIAEFVTKRVPSLPIPSLHVVAGAGVIALLVTVLVNYRAIDQRQNHIARSFGEDIFASVEPWTVLLASGDEVVLPLTYLHTVERRREDVDLVLLPLLPADWYLNQLRERYPDLHIPFTHYDGRSSSSLKTLIDANKERTIVIVGTVANNDKSLQGSYWFRERGLVNVIEPIAEEFDLRQVAIDNDQLLKRYRPPAPHAIKANSFESNILLAYAAPALRIANNYERIGLRQEARTWYHRAISLDPDLPKARAGIARLGP